jgi:hypothetical protein
MASGHKELGQIHTLNYYIQSKVTGTHELDISGELSKQLQRLIRQGNFFKIVGIDLTAAEFGGKGGGLSMNGYLRYYAPTRGRCSAYRKAFEAMRTAMNLQGINMKDNEQYDFRVLFNNEATTPFVNIASLDGTNPLMLYDGTETPSSPSFKGLFNVHNRGVKPAETEGTTPDFSAGFNTMGVQTTPTDFVLNDGVIWSGNEEWADAAYETIPFQLAYSPDSDDTAFTIQWRPDPALYLAVMTGMIQVNVEEVSFNGDADEYEFSIAVHCSGWKSIMGNPDKKKRSSRGRRRRSKK